MEGSDGNWQGSPLDMQNATMDAYGIREIVIEYDSGDSDVFRPRLRDEFHSYELQQMAEYLDSIAHSLRKSQQ